MKKIVLLLFFLVFGFTSFGQSLPKYYIVNNDTLGLILSIDQVKKIKNDLELKEVLEDMKISCDSTINKYFILVDDCEKTIASLNRTVTKMDSSDKNSKKLVESLTKELEIGKKDKMLCDSIVAKQDTVIRNTDTIISDLKCKRNLGYGGTILFLITTIIFIVL